MWSERVLVNMLKGFNLFVEPKFEVDEFNITDKNQKVLVNNIFSLKRFFDFPWDLNHLNWSPPNPAALNLSTQGGGGGGVSAWQDPACFSCELCLPFRIKPHPWRFSFGTEGLLETEWQCSTMVTGTRGWYSCKEEEKQFLDYNKK